MIKGELFSGNNVEQEVLKEYTKMDNSTQHILLQLEIILKEYPEAKFYIQDQIRLIISDLLNSEDLVQQFQQ